ncbi:hypothetical protein [Mycolicibacterium llatzerense]|uniref:hypothetical protein n=1 Tax=Mycolicibacterium llatzerense TaxID=280871 RepID=UPI0009F2A75E|nr:hypothetical protein [Mycolicibacterium llatzerense]
MSLHWDGGYGWVQTTPADITPPPFEGPRTLYAVFGYGSKKVDLYVWSGPKEFVLGAMGADLRSMKRAISLGEFSSMTEAKEVAAAFHATGELGPTPLEVLPPLEFGPRYDFVDWPNADIEAAPAGVYTIWDGDGLIYVGMAGRRIGVDPETPPAAGALHATPRNPLRSRLNAHPSGRRSGDQFCVYVSDRFVVPSLDVHQLRRVGEGTLKLDLLTKRHIRQHLSYRYITELGGYPALQLERLVQRGALGAGKPYLNPL